MWVARQASKASIQRDVYSSQGEASPVIAKGAADATSVIQPSQAYTSATAGGNLGALTSAVSNQVGMGTNRQFALRFNF